MTIYYLYVKTHKITGLKYLGYTGKEDPYTYTGSGTRWLNHLHVHGFNFTTEILKECTSKTEIREHGVYFSRLWNVVSDKNWANLKEEQGDGGGCFGEVNGMFGKTHSPEEKIAQGIRAVKRFKNKSYEELYGKEKADILKQKRSASTKGKDNSFSKNPRFDNTEYTFMNLNTGEIIHCTRWVLIHSYGVSKPSACGIINHNSVACGWTLFSNHVLG